MLTVPRRPLSEECGLWGRYSICCLKDCTKNGPAEQHWYCIAYHLHGHCMASLHDAWGHSTESLVTVIHPCNAWLPRSLQMLMEQDLDSQDISERSQDPGQGEHWVPLLE